MCVCVCVFSHGESLNGRQDQFCRGDGMMVVDGSYRNLERGTEFSFLLICAALHIASPPPQWKVP